jgi:23S rRNA (cytosine1962-C5)-methyltransferase
MNILATKGWEDYELLDSGDSKRLERYGKYLISKPDPQAIWKQSLSQSEWNNADAKYENNTWIKSSGMPDKWKIRYKDLQFYAKLTPFKHTGIFPEQCLNWDFIKEKIKNSSTQPNVLNLFAYTGAASLVAAKNGAKVTHLDASKPSIAWAKENQELCGLSDKPIRWILDDALEFTAREARRGIVYDGIIMDPPVYGHGPSKEVWDFDESVPKLLENCAKILSNTPLFVIINAYAVSTSSIMLKNLFEDYFSAKNIEYGELVLEQSNKNRLLSTGLFARYSSI